MVAALFIVVGAALLIKGADLLVDGGSGIALKSGVSHLVVGLTVVAFGTSAPELAASLIAAFKGAGDICFGNIVGSNVANIALILGVAALIRPIDVNRLLIRWELPFMIGISLLTWYIGWKGHAGVSAGIVLLVLFMVYLVRCFKHPPLEMDVEDEAAKRGYALLIVMVIAGIAALALGGMLFVKGARDIALALGVSEAVIGLTVVALGTSLPELITSAVASVKGNADISLGNIVGSNIFNILFVLGTTAVIHPYDISPDRYMALAGMPFMIVSAVLLLLFSLGAAGLIGRVKGMVFLAVYIVYVALAVILT